MTHLRRQPPRSAVQACVGLLMCEVQHCMHSIGQGHHTIKVAESSARHSKWTRWGSNRFSTVLRVKVANLQTEICMRSRGEIASNPWSTQSAQTPHRIKTGMRQEPINRPHRLVVRTSRCGRDNPGSTPGVVILFMCPVRQHRPRQRDCRYHSDARLQHV